MSLIPDSRDRNHIYRHLLSVAPNYVPEWSAGRAGKDFGHSLLRVYTEMLAGTIARFNRLPYKNYIYFLNLLGAELLPATPAEGYLTIRSSQSRSLLVKKGTRVYSTDGDGEKILFELCDSLAVEDNSITDIFCRSGNTIVRAGENGDIKLFDFYEGENLQAQSLVVSSENVLNIRGRARVCVTILNGERPFVQDESAHILSEASLCRWEYLGPDGWTGVETVGCRGNSIDLSVEGEIPLTELNSAMGRWLRCAVSNELTTGISLTDIKITSEATVAPDCLYNNDLHLPDKSFLPFGESLARFDSFSIGCDEAFTKRGAQITLELRLSFKESPVSGEPREIEWKPVMPASELREPEEVRIYVESVVWEYWNGNGWVRLFEHNEYSGAFKSGGTVKARFLCPPDMEQTFIGGSQSRFIRARILKHSDIFTRRGNYVCPVVDSVTLSYAYGHEGPSVDTLLSEKDLSITSGNRSTEIYVCGYWEKNPAAYFALKRPLPKEAISLYFRNKADLYNPPTVVFEYYGEMGGRRGWFELSTADETGCFSVSGMNTFVSLGAVEGKRLNLFSVDGYWLRAVNTDGGYNTEAERPHISGIYFNTVKIRQEEARVPEYFSVEYGERNKQCALGGRNIAHERVWVNELSETPSYEITPGARGERWVEWTRADSLGGAGSEDRVYILEPAQGVITFGNGIRGKIPTAGTDTVRIEYSVCSGSIGNLEPNEIQGFADSVPFVSELYNVAPISGGSDEESLYDAVHRCAGFIEHLDRAVSIRDYEAIVASDRGVLKARANLADDRLTIAALPVPGSDFWALRKRLFSGLVGKAPAVLTQSERLNIIEVSYIEFSIRVHIRIGDLKRYNQVRSALEEKLNDFFEPMSGGADGKGFEIGALPTKVQIINYIKGVVSASIVRLDIFCRERTNGTGIETDYEKAVKNPFAVPINGKHEIVIME